MPNVPEITKDSINDFMQVQRYMKMARKENATETYKMLKEQYLALKATLQTIGVNLTEIDTINE